MSKYSICRAAHVNVYLDALRAIGAPVDKKLASSGLPIWLEEYPDARVNQPLAMELVAACAGDFAPMELGFFAAERATLDTLDPSFQRSLVDAISGQTRLETLIRGIHREDSAMAVRTRREGAHVRIVCDMSHLSNHRHIHFNEWLNLQGITSIIGSVAGPKWRPIEYTFMSRHTPPDAALEAYGNTRILVGQARTSLLVDADVLTRPCMTREMTPPRAWKDAAYQVANNDQSIDLSLTDALRSVIRPYLEEGRTDLDHIAEMLGLSSRTLQRRLQQSGRSYSEIVQEARFEVARDMLAEPDAKIIDVAMMAGYERPQHFSRAFRRFTGVSPRQYRKATSAALGEP